MKQLITIEELKELRAKLQEEQMKENDYQKIFNVVPIERQEEIKEEEEVGRERESFQKVKTNPKAPSLLDKTGFSNVIYLATMSLLFEVVFLAVSFLIYT